MHKLFILAQITLLLWAFDGFFSTASAQAGSDWQPVPKEDLTLTDNPDSPGSSAMILERQLYTDDEKRFQTEFVRIKVFTEAGRGNADIEIPYLAKSMTVSDIRGRTLRADGAMINFDGVVFDNVAIKYKKIRYDVKTFTLPGVEVGSVIEYAYTIHWKEKVPDVVRNSLMYLVEGGWAFPTATWTVQQGLFTRHASFSLRPVKGGNLRWAKVRLPDIDPRMSPDGTIRMEVFNVPPIEPEEFMPAETMINSRVHFFYVVGNYFSFWQDYGKYRARNAEKLIEQTKSLERVAQEIAPADDPAETRLRKLYARAQQIRYLSFEPSRTRKEAEREHLAENKSAEDIIRHGYGYANEINYLFTALARAAGFDASIVEVVDRRSATFEPEVLDFTQLNDIVVLVVLEGRKLYFDPATRFCPYEELPWYENNTTGVIWNRFGGAIVHVENRSIQIDAIERTADLKLQGDGALEGTLDVSFTGQEAVDRRIEGIDEDDGGRRTLIEDEIKGWLPAGTTVDLDSIQGWETSEAPLHVRCRLRVPQFATSTRERMLFPTGVFQVNRKAALSHLNRKLPIYFGHGHREIDNITVAPPSGYRIEAIPIDGTVDSAFASFDEKRTNQNGNLHLERNTELRQFLFPRSSYGALWLYFQQLRKSDGERVVLHADITQAR